VGRWMAKQGDVWLNREMGGSVGRCMDKKEDGWLSGEMGG
jgi:hypothetical protein